MPTMCHITLQRIFKTDMFLVSDLAVPKNKAVSLFFPFHEEEKY
jgi:hypothetical protein